MLTWIDVLHVLAAGIVGGVVGFGVTKWILRRLARRGCGGQRTR